MSEIKICTICLVELPLGCFYSKGNRLDSACKNCVKTRKKTKYVTVHENLSFETLMKIFKLIQDLELEEINNEVKKVDRVIEQWEQKIMQ